MTNKIKVVLIGTLLAVLLFSVPVLAEEGDEVILLSDAKASDYVEIVIDGYFSDWSDKPMSSIYYDSGTSHIGSLYRDENYVYLYIQMSWPNYPGFNGYNYIFTLDGKTYTFDVVPVSGSIDIGLNAMKVMRVNGYQQVGGANGYVSHSDDRGDRMEMRIPLDYFYKQPDKLVTITFHSPNLGTQVLTATGTPTMPILIAGSGLVLAGTALFVRKRKRTQ